MDDQQAGYRRLDNSNEHDPEGRIPGEDEECSPGRELALVAERTRLALVSGSRDPFISSLERLLGAHPTDTRLAEWAGDQPDRYFSALSQVAKLAGYTEKMETQGHIDLASKSDAEIQAMIDDALADRAKPVGG